MRRAVNQHVWQRPFKSLHLVSPRGLSVATPSAIARSSGNRKVTGTLLTSFNRCRALHTTPAQLRASLKYPPVGGGLRRTATAAPDPEASDDDDDDDNDLERELDEFDPEELFEDDDITNRPQQRDTAVGSADAAIMKEISDFNLSGEQYHRLGMWDEAEQAFRDTLALVDENLGSHHPTAAVVLNNLAMVYRQKGDLEEAERLLHQALNLRRAHFGTSHPRVALILDHLGSIYRQQKRTEEALEVFRQSLTIIEECDTRKRTPDGTVAVLAAKVEGDADSQQNDDDDVVVPADTETTSGAGGDDEDWEDLINLGTAQNNLGLVYYQVEDYAKAEVLFASAVTKAKQREREREEMERRGEAGEEQVKAQRVAHPLAPTSTIIQKNLAQCLFKQGKLEQSERELKDVLDHLREEVGLREHDEPVIEVFRHLARVYLAMGKTEESTFYADKVTRNEERKKAAAAAGPQ